MNSTTLATYLKFSSSQRRSARLLLQRTSICVALISSSAGVNVVWAQTQDFDIKFPADLSGHDGGTADGAEAKTNSRNNSGMPNELLTPVDPVTPSTNDPLMLMQEGSPIPDVINPAAPEKKNASNPGKPATVASASELFEAGKKFEDNQEFGRALSSYEDAIKLFRSSRKDAGSTLPTQVAQKYAALLRKLNNPQKATIIEKEFAAAQP